MFMYLLDKTANTLNITAIVVNFVHVALVYWLIEG